MALPTYATRETISRATDYATTALRATHIDRALQSASRSLETRLHRHFYPLTETVTFQDPYPLAFSGSSWAFGFYLERDLRSVTAVTVDGTAVASTDYSLHPSKYGPPYSAIDLPSFVGVTTVINGLWGYSADTKTGGTITANISTTTATTLSCSDASLVGIGDLILINSEQMVVTGRATADTTTNTNGALTADIAEQTVTVGDGTAIKLGETITIDTERMLVTNIVTNDLTVERAYDGSTLAAHSDATDVYAARTLTVVRGQVGTTATIHTSADTITVNVPPAEIVEACIAETLTLLEQESSGYGRVIGSGEGQREAAGKGLADVRRRVDRLRRQRAVAV